MKGTSLIVEGDREFRFSLRQAIAATGLNVLDVSTSAEARRILRTHRVCLLVVNLNLADGCGLHVVSEARDRLGEIPVILLNGDSRQRWICPLGMRHTDAYFGRPYDLVSLGLTVRHVLGPFKRRPGGGGSEDADPPLDPAEELRGESVGLCQVRDQIRMLAPIHRPVLIVGESGTGKQLVASALHRLSPRAAGPFCEENCGRLSEGLLESRLFGHEKGAFTGAVKQERGLFEQAAKGTLFLDDILETTSGVQEMLLKAMEKNAFRRVGGDREIPADVRVLAATNREPEEAAREGKLRQDFFYRIARFQIRLPPLRERQGDAVLLAEHFLEQACKEFRKGPMKLTAGAKDALLRHPWPGNVRQLQSAMDRVALYGNGGEVDGAAVEAAIEDSAAGVPRGAPTPDPLAPLPEVVSWHIRRALDAVGGDKTKAAAFLRVHRNTLSQKLKPQ